MIKNTLYNFSLALFTLFSTLLFANNCPKFMPMPSFDGLHVVVPIYNMAITKADFDCDGIIDSLDNDIDNDGVPNHLDADDYNPNIGIIKQFDINAIPGGDFSTAKATLNAITKVGNLQKVNTAWLPSLTSDSWIAYDSDGRNYKLIFNENGTYVSENILIQDGKTYRSKFVGKWFIYEKVGTQKYHLFLTQDNNPSHLEHYPLEKEGEDGFRIIYKYSTYARSLLYSRASLDFAVFPGINLIGTYTEKYAYTDANGNSHHLSFTFKKNGTLDYRDYIVSFINGTTLHQNIVGTWRLNATTSKLILTFQGTNYIYDIKYATHNSLSLLDSQGEGSFLQKTQIYRHTFSVTHMEGEYQNRENETYFSIRKSGNNYIVDYVPNYVSFTGFKNVPAEQLDNGDLKLFYPTGHFDEGKEIILRAGYNRLLIIKGISTPPGDMQKVSKHAMLNNPTSILGGWRNAIYSSSNFMSYINFYKNGQFRDNAGYGKYTVSGNQITLTKTCEIPKVYTAKFPDHKLDLNVPYSAVPGLRDWGDEGSTVGSILFKHSLDLYQRQNSPKLKAHPTIKGAYLFAKKVDFSALVTLDNYVNYTLEPNGTGSWHAGFLTEYEDFSDHWILKPGSSLRFGIKYFIVQDKNNNKEYIVYYPEGLVLVNLEGNFNVITQLQENNKDIRTVELYHRRTALCEEGRVVVPLSKN